MRTCTVEGCEKTHRAKGLCSMHWERQRKGRPLGGAEPLRVAGVYSACQVEGCARPHKAKGLCNMHRGRQRTGRPLDGPLRTPRGHFPTCTVEGCARSHKVKGLCEMHDGRRRRGIPLDAPPRGRKPCAVGGCGKTARGKRLCHMHYSRQRRGQPLDGPSRRRPDRPCAVTGCPRKHMAKGLCGVHFRRQQAGRPLGGPEKLRGAYKANTICGHTDRRHCALGMCQHCWQRQPHRQEKDKAAKEKYLSGHWRTLKERAWQRQGIDADAAWPALERAGGRCEICWGTERLGVDHSHTTGKVRGVLCWLHNQGLGLFGDDPALLERAAAYLREYGGLREVVEEASA